MVPAVCDNDAVRFPEVCKENEVCTAPKSNFML